MIEHKLTIWECLATCINALALQDSFRTKWRKTRVQTAIEMREIGRTFY